MYIVRVADNFHYMDKDEVYTRGTYATWEEALEVAKGIVDAFLLENHSGGMTSQSLYDRFISFGEDPYIVGGSGQSFSAWEYAKARCDIICDETA